MVYFISVIVVGVICGAVCTAISSNSGMEGGFWWGFFLGIIGIIVVAVRPNDNSAVNGVPAVKDDEERIYYCPSCRETFSCMSQQRCPQCQTILRPTTVMFSAWKNLAAEEKDRLKAEFEAGRSMLDVKSGSADSQTANSPYEEIRQLKGLLEDGIITQEEFEAKKKALLGL